MKLNAFLDEMEIPANTILFDMKIRVGQLLGDKSFNPDRELIIKANTTKDFIDKLKNDLKSLGEPTLSKESENILWDKLSDLEMSYHAKTMALKNAVKDMEGKFN